MSYSNSLQFLWKEAKNYLELQKEYLKLDAAEKLSVLLSAVATIVICLTFALAALFFFAIAFGFWLANFVGMVWGFVIMGGFILLLIATILLARKRWIVQPITRFIVKLLIDENNVEKDAV